MDFAYEAPKIEKVVNEEELQIEAMYAADPTVTT